MGSKTLVEERARLHVSNETCKTEAVANKLIRLTQVSWLAHIQTNPISLKPLHTPNPILPQQPPITRPRLNPTCRHRRTPVARAQNYQEIKTIAKEIVKELGYHTKVADWNRKEYLKAKLRTAVKNVLIKIIDGRASYTEIE